MLHRYQAYNSVIGISVDNAVEAKKPEFLVMDLHLSHKEVITVKGCLGPKEIYPELRRNYSNKIGMWGEIVISSLLDEYQVIPHLVNESGADVKIEPFSIGIEIWNHSRPHAYVQRARSVVRNLAEFKSKYMVASFISPEIKRYFENNGIVVIELGFQVIHPEYFGFYLNNYRMEGKKTFNKRTEKIMRNKLKPVYQAINIQQQQKDLQNLKESLGDCPYISKDSHVCDNTKNNTKHQAYASLLINQDKGNCEGTIPSAKEDGENTISRQNACGNPESEPIESLYLMSRYYGYLIDIVMQYSYPPYS